MASTFKLSEFNPETDDALTYVTWLFHGCANMIEDSNKLSMKITIIRTKSDNDIVDFVFPDELDSKTYEKVMELFKTQCIPERQTVEELYTSYLTREDKNF
ncbi:hypothetical protein JTE90_012451 [Oedothorax gibbosus]|uniref:Uncharacterized protein n=1 Tax=Oedothorax gibbosus TaxID=931172 RepID=A0AAV6UEE4_9ARAC|nr:hypothetical protein JTE90_012451 [Oedothorax gibbosus]